MILISDLDDDPGDDVALRSIALAYRHDAVRLRIVALNPAPNDQQRFSQLLGSAADITPAHLPGEQAAAGQASSRTCLCERCHTDLHCPGATWIAIERCSTISPESLLP